MRATFAGLETARKALSTQQYALESTLHNVANANTPGFSRQRVDMGPTIPQKLGYIHGLIGNGVKIDAVIRIRDEFLDYQLRNEYSTTSYREYSAIIYSRLESFFSEPGDGGLKVALNRFYDAWQNLSRDVADVSLRAEVRASGDVLCSVLNAFDYQMWQLIQDIDASILASVASVNTIADQIAALNYDIFVIETDSNFRANDLRDRRDLLLDQLSSYVEIKQIEEDSRLAILVGGVRLVSHDTVNHLDTFTEVSRLKANPDLELPEKELHWHKVQWVFAPGVTLPADIDSGTLGAQLQMRYDVQYVYRDYLDAWAREFAMVVNHQHRQGYYQDENGDWQTGMDFFVPAGWNEEDFGLYSDYYTDEDVIQFSGYNIRVNPAILDSIIGLNFIAGVGIDEDGVFPGAPGPDGPYIGNNINAVLLAQIRNNKPRLLELYSQIQDDIDGSWLWDQLQEAPFIFNMDNTFEEKFHAFLLELGIRADSNYRLFENSEYQTKMLEQRRSSVSDVSLDEEMTNMIRFQQAYAAAARLSSSLNEVLTILMERVFR